MPYADYQGVKGFKWAGTITDNDIKEKKELNDADYVILNKNTYDAFNGEKDCLKNMILLKTFLAKNVFYGNDYIVLSNKTIKTSINKIIDDILVLGYTSEREINDGVIFLKMNIFWKALRPPRSALSLCIFVKKDERIIGEMRIFPLSDNYKRRSSQEWKDPSEIFMT